MDLFVGTSGYNYKEWKGHFYPQKFADKEMLDFYGKQFNSVEINNTFYRVPKADVVISWAEKVPTEFRFVLKATRRITHLKRLKNVEEETPYFLDISANLGDRLGAILFQMPPNLKKDMGRLQTFLGLLPDGSSVAMEFRNDSWFDDEVFESLREKGIALCFAHEDDDTTDKIDGRFQSTASRGYLRLRGSEYDEEELTAWAAKVAEQKWDRVFIFFKHEAAGLGPKLARRFLDASV